MSAPIRILIVAALCIAGLIGLVVRESMARAAGTEVVLAMEAVDPRALLGGHYVIVNLRELLTPEESCPEFGDDAAWIALTPVEGHHSVAGAAPTREAAQQIAPIAVRGTITCNPPVAATKDVPGQNGALWIDLGIDRFHINQTEAERIDHMLRDQVAGEEARVFAIVSVGQDGRARLQGLVVDGERLELGWS